jgi:hypothetical protein
LSLAFEYQGETHFFSSHTYGSASKRQQNDIKKMKFAKEFGITVIPVPFWWNKSSASLVSTIRSHRPELLPTHQTMKPIPLNMPETIPRVKHRINAAQLYDERVDPTGW